MTLRPISVLRFWISQGLTQAECGFMSRGGILMSTGSLPESLSQKARAVAASIERHFRPTGPGHQCVFAWVLDKAYAVQGQHVPCGLRVRLSPDLPKDSLVIAIGCLGAAQCCPIETLPISVSCIVCLALLLLLVVVVVVVVVTSLSLLLVLVLQSVIHCSWRPTSSPYPWWP